MRSIFFFMLVFLFSLLSACGQKLPLGIDQPGPKVCTTQQCFAVEVADEGPEQQKGLMGRTSLAANKGMLFVFPHDGSRQFWMKDTLIPLDILWLNASGTVSYIASKTPPCQADPCPVYGPKTQDARYVLELASGVSIDAAIRVGDSVQIRLQ